LKISARNNIPCKIENLNDLGLITAVYVKTTEPTVMTAVITREAADQMKIEKNDVVKVIVKPTEVMIKNL